MPGAGGRLWARGRGDWFVDLFTSEAERLIDYVKESWRPRSLSVEGYWWAGSIPAGAEPQPVAAVDGGGGLQPLVGGGAVYIARAYGYLESGEPVRGLELRIYPVRDTRLLDALRSWLEHRVAIRLLYRLEEGSALLMDGSLWSLVSASLGTVVRVARGGGRSLAQLYTALLSGYTLVAINELVEEARSRRVSLAYVSKDPGFRVLKEQVLLGRVAEEAGGVVAERLREALAWYPLHDRKGLLRMRRAIPSRLLAEYDAGLDPSYRDTLFISDVVGEGVGYTWPIRIPPPRQLARALEGSGGTRAIANGMCEAVHELLGDREGEECWGLAPRLASAIDSLPSISAFYARFGHGDQPLLVETPEDPGFLAPGRELSRPTAETAALVSVLYRGYAGPEYYNVPLMAAHESATLDGRQLLHYMRLLESLAAARGVRLRLARRYAIGLLGSRRRRGRRRPR